MKLLVLAMHRTGHNAIAKWLLRQSNLKNRPLWPLKNAEFVETVIVDNKKYRFIPTISHPNNLSFSKYLDVDNIVISIERESTNFAIRFINNYQLQSFKKVIVLRRFDNWLASVGKMQNNFNISALDIEKYESHTREISGEKWYPIIYGQWFTQREYRKRICKDLDIEFTDYGLTELSTYGGGSSFTGLTHLNNAQNLNSLTRYTQVSDNSQYQQTLRKYSYLNSYINGDFQKEIYNPLSRFMWIN